MSNEDSKINGSRTISISIRLIIIGILMFSILYPLFLGGIGQLAWKNSTNGSQIKMDDKVVGSKLIGQNFDEPKFFHPRPSSIEYNATTSGSQNLGPNNPELAERIEGDLQDLVNWSNNTKIPVTLITESGSALDPHITTEAAFFQVPRISNTTEIPEQKLENMIKDKSKSSLLGIFGMKRVNVLELNILIEKKLRE